MTVRAPFFVSACVVAAVAGLSTHRSLSEPSNGMDAARSTAVYDKKVPASGALARAGISSRETSKVVSATREFDLAKLTLADFGDVEPLR